LSKIFWRAHEDKYAPIIREINLHRLEFLEVSFGFEGRKPNVNKPSKLFSSKKKERKTVALSG
jgi:ABC-type transport system involved in Fe-S cluster assembly fused permease/ATPase subunit